MPRKYEKIKELLPNVMAKVESGQTRKQITKGFGLQDEKVVRNLLYRAHHYNQTAIPRLRERKPAKLYRNINTKTNA